MSKSFPAKIQKVQASTSFATSNSSSDSSDSSDTESDSDSDSSFSNESDPNSFNTTRSNCLKGESSFQQRLDNRTKMEWDRNIFDDGLESEESDSLDLGPMPGAPLTCNYFL